MSHVRKYPVRVAIRQACALLKVSEARVLSRAGLTPEFFQGPEEPVDIRGYFRLWHALEAEADSVEAMLLAAREAARGPFNPTLLAFSCSPNIQVGLERVALFKPLIGPFRLDSSLSGGRLTVVCRSSEPGLALPSTLAAMEAVFLISWARVFTGQEITPLEIAVPDPGHFSAPLLAYFGCTPRRGPACRVVFSQEDAQRPLISEDTAFWRLVQAELHARLAASLARQDGPSTAERLRDVLVDMLPGGQVSVAGAASRLGLSERSLQRRLKAEATSFQTELDRVRVELAQTYLARGDLTTEQISYLLAYRDPNSFYRAFHGWTGKTPAQAREALLAGATG
ncbi:AraC family transcriptional regulator [Oceanicola sp. S124]|uniref:AraC family transcriptional regulator n=1 Tax=Oceanicola sp. S124 TaxID=1042378 RepID=UPI00025582AF|nr:AraC family transcriptional regulator [Oceanicola sp. S124]